MKITKDDVGREVRLRNGDITTIDEVDDTSVFPVMTGNCIAYTTEGTHLSKGTSSLDIASFVDEPEISMDKTYQTRNGIPVRILCTDRNRTHYKVVGLEGTTPPINTDDMPF